MQGLHNDGAFPSASIELFSLPGAGKSTLANALARDLGLRSRADLSAAWSRRSPLRKLACIGTSFLDLRTIASALQLAFRLRLRSRESLFRLGRLIAKRAWIQSQHRRTLFDQGFLQDLWSILYAAGCFQPPPRLLAPLIARLYRGMDVRVLCIELEPGIAADRIAGRSDGDSRLDGLSRHDVLNRLQQSAGIPAALKQAASDAGLDVRRLDGATPAAALVDQARDLLHDVATHRRTPEE